MNEKSESRAGKIRKRLRVLRGLVILVLAVIARGNASVSLLMEEPYGEFGAFNPTGHAAVYLNHICADKPTQLRACASGELGVVISRYHRVDRDDWLAIPLIPYLYAVDDLAAVPASVTKADVVRLRDAYWKEHLVELAPAGLDGGAPKGEWTQLVGSSYDRKIHGFEVDTTTEQDERLMAYFNDRRNVAHFNLLFHNCADFSRVLLDIYFPHAIHRNFVADLGITTPKQVARSLVGYGKKHPELNMSAFTIAQVPGTVRRSHPVDGVAESVVKSKRYIIPLVVLSPQFAGALAVGYLAEGRMRLPKDATVFEAGAEDTSGSAAPIESLAKEPAPKAME